MTGRRDVLIFLTPFAPGVAPDAPIGGEGRRVEHWGAPPRASIAALLERLKRSPAEVWPRASALGDVVLLGRMPADAPAHLRPGSVQPLAYVAHGLAEAEITAVLDALKHPAGAAA